MSATAAAGGHATGMRRVAVVIGVSQLIVYGCTYYLPAVLAAPAAADLGLSRATVLGAFSWALLVAGLGAPIVGRRIDRAGGRGVLAMSCAVMAAGLVALATAHGLVLWYVGWIALGAGMALGLYDAAFATLGVLYGHESGRAITGVTLIAGFASTVFWPLGTALEASWGWRGMLLAYAALLLAVNLPAMLFAVPPGAAHHRRGAAIADDHQPVADPGRALVLLALFFTLRWLITSGIAVLILRLLQERGLAAAEAVAVAALIGPGQVLGRIVEWSFTKRIPLFTRARAAALLMPLAALLLLLPGVVPAGAFALLYGMSNGIMTINRGTLPMALFGRAGYAQRLGWLATPALLAQAAAPPLAAMLLAAVAPKGAILVAALLGLIAALSLSALGRAVDARPAAPDATGTSPRRPAS
jgi:MFS family permease